MTDRPPPDEPDVTGDGEVAGARPDPAPPDDAWVRETLVGAVADVDPPDDLEDVMNRTGEPSRRRAWLAALATAGVVAASTLGAVQLLGGEATTAPPATQGSAAPAPSPSVTPSRPATPPTPTAGESATPSTPEPAQEPDRSGSSQPEPSVSAGESTPPPAPRAEAAGAPGASGALPVYYAGQTSRGLRLFREFHADPQASSLEARVRAAVTDAVTLAPADPDYRLVWPAGTTVRRVVHEPADDVPLRVRLDVPGLADMTSRERRTGAQQLVWTGRAVLGEQTRMVLTLDGPEPGSTDSSRVVTAGDALDVLAQVWVVDPAEGSAVDGRRLRVSGLANAFEATVLWRLVSDAGEGGAVRRGFTTAEQAGTMAPYRFAVRVGSLPAGEYLLVVSDNDPSGGEGFAPWRDTKRVTLR